MVNRVLNIAAILAFAWACPSGAQQVHETVGWRSGSGMGLRCHWQSTIVRADYGTSGGRRAIYITFSQVF